MEGSMMLIAEIAFNHRRAISSLQKYSFLRRATPMRKKRVL